MKGVVSFIDQEFSTFSNLWTRIRTRVRFFLIFILILNVIILAGYSASAQSEIHGQNWISDSIGDSGKSCVDIVYGSVEVDRQNLTASLVVEGDFCQKSHFLFHIDTNDDGDSDMALQTRFGSDGIPNTSGAPYVEAIIDPARNLLSWTVPVEQIPVENPGETAIFVWFNAHLADSKDLLPDTAPPGIRLPIGSDAGKILGPEGGMVEVLDPDSPIFGVSIDVPRGALIEPTGITIVNNPDFMVPSDPVLEETISLPPFVLEPSDVLLQQPVKIIVPVPDSDGDGVLDFTNLRTDSGSLLFLMEGMDELYRADTYFDPASQTLNAFTVHFSTWLGLYHRWQTGSVVRYWIDSLPANQFYHEDLFRQEVADAFAQWSEAIYANVTFVETQVASDADVKIQARDFCSFWFLGGQYCGNSGIKYRPLLGDFTWIVGFNTNAGPLYPPRIWVSGSYDPYPPYHADDYEYQPFLRVALHEFGHVMGLNDYNRNEYCNTRDIIDSCEGQIMWQECGINVPPLEHLGCFDVSEVKRHYGLSTSAVALSADFERDIIGGFPSSDNVVPPGALNLSRGPVSVLDSSNPLASKAASIPGGIFGGSHATAGFRLHGYQEPSQIGGNWEVTWRIALATGIQSPGLATVWVIGRGDCLDGGCVFSGTLAQITMDSQTIGLDTPVSARLAIDLDAKNYDFYIDDMVVVSDHPFYGDQTRFDWNVVQAIGISNSFFSDGAVIVDDLTISTMGCGQN